MNPFPRHFDAVVIGGGIAGIVTALELLDHGRSVAILERGTPSKLGGQAYEAFGGMWFTGTPIQRSNRIKDSKELATRDWLHAAEFGPEDVWQKKWALSYINEGSDTVYQWLTKELGIRFLPAPGWVERGDYTSGNSVPRYHIMWGSSEKLTRLLVQRLMRHKQRRKLTLVFHHDVQQFIYKNGRVIGCIAENNGIERRFHGRDIVIASGGVTGSEEEVRRLWPNNWPKVPDYILNGSHEYSDGKLHRVAAEDLSANVTHLDAFWNYAAGIHHPYSDRMDPKHGASLIPPRSGLWANCYGRRIGPMPLVSGFDTRHLCQRVCEQDHGYTWQVMNWEIAKRELNISGAIFNTAIRDERKLTFLANLLRVPDDFLKQIEPRSRDIITADTLDELVASMNRLSGHNRIDKAVLEAELTDYDRQLTASDGQVNDDQVRRIVGLRQWKGDRLRICRGQPILDPAAGPLVAIRLHLITRKSLGGINTDLSSRVLRSDGSAIDGLYAVGEASGFGGGGVNGRRSLEGTFLSLCIYNAMKAASAINATYQAETVT
ncbi:FAD-dependent oxidoreductase [Leisingera sp. NJS204]|uniref:FAD-dependent oxidoreductase n=1 Tax=Leisingera sp. NJS204 TaxID=2508307 RepID=UPI001010C901|nr:FAD-dependent oxidoreductase [Leisingera sp. NJS204]QAX28752.1 FAD-dependent oxidoreductase [Leisingera sp. NJS204]